MTATVTTPAKLWMHVDLRTMTERLFATAIPTFAEFTAHHRPESACPPPGCSIVRTDELEAAITAYLANDDPGLRGAMADLSATREGTAGQSIDSTLLGLVAEGIEAFRLTREYVGEDRLSAVEGWEWFDWTEKARRALAETPPLVPGGVDFWTDRTVSELIAEAGAEPVENPADLELQGTSDESWAALETMQEERS